MKWYLFKGIFIFNCDCGEILECKHVEKLVSVRCPKCNKNSMFNPHVIYKTHNRYGGENK